MQPTDWEVIILKPTAVFLSFLSSELPGIELPTLRFLQSDCTAYVIAKQTNDEAMLEEIERCFPFMFKHEIYRRFGSQRYKEIEGSFLDFLCCFKFELHSQPILLEESLEKGKQLLRIKPRTVLLKWMRTQLQDNTELTTVLDHIKLSQLVENATVIVKNFSTILEVKNFLKQYYKSIFESEMLRMCEQVDHWPEVDSYQAFMRYFAIDVHTQLIHLH